jgi:anti-sigma regulatory factor (Ser/Thr protein kinase)
MGQHSATRRPLAELKLLASPELIPTAKRTAAALGSLVGFGVEDLDDLNIAVAQACDQAIEAGRQRFGEEATLKLSFWETDQGIEVDVQALPGRSPHTRPPERALADHHREHHEREEAFDRIAHDMIRLFVDDFRPSVARNRIRYRMVKYLIG